MSNDHHLLNIVQKQKAGVAQGIFSVCSANEFVIEAALQFGKKKNVATLIEATSNQVNQFGGYTGMKPSQFSQFVQDKAKEAGLSAQLLILGGDHLGPNPWQKEPAKSAMEKAVTLVKDYTLAGFTKIHLDASMYLADDEGDRRQPLHPKIVAERTAQLALAAEEAYVHLLKTKPQAEAPVYVVGSEVPVPGGIMDEEAELKVTTPEDFENTVALTKEAFLARDLEAAWERVVGVVVQPGVEFGDDAIDEYDAKKAKALSQALKRYPSLVFEGHSTDYQQAHHLKEMVADGVGILKVGPELTFALREALFLLQHLEEELLSHSPKRLSNLMQTVDKVMLQQPANWQPYYHGTEDELRFSRKYSLSDRIRYYWPQAEVNEALATLLNNLNSTKIPLTILSQYFPRQYQKIRAGELNNKPESLIKDHIQQIYEKYYFAVNP